MIGSTVVDLIVATLEEAGVRRVDGVAGSIPNDTTDSIQRDGSIA